VRLAEAGADVVINYVTSQAAAERVAEQVQTLGVRRGDGQSRRWREGRTAKSMMEFIGQQFGRLEVPESGNRPQRGRVSSAAGHDRTQLRSDDEDERDGLDSAVQSAESGCWNGRQARQSDRDIQPRIEHGHPDVRRGWGRRLRVESFCATWHWSWANEGINVKRGTRGSGRNRFDTQDPLC